MNIIIVANPAVGTRVIQLGEPKHRRIAIASLLAAVLVVAGLGAWFGAGVLGPKRAQERLAQTRAELGEQQAEVERLSKLVNRDMNALAMRLGRLQAESTRLNALGERLAEIGKLNDGEFDFGSEPDVGGPLAPALVSMPPAEFGAEIQRLERQMSTQSKQLSLLEGLLIDSSLDASLMPNALPVRSGYISSNYGYRTDPFTGGRDFHPGIDFDGNMGDTILAVAGGVVSFAGNKTGYGKTVEIDHGNGLVTRYGHCSRLDVQVGDPVRTGTQIAAMGSTGRSTGTHLHFEVWKEGKLVNPRDYLKAQQH
ncbi:hypothetical protein C7S18_01345 [Ahniella affigens]|uniref:M23ase beta-sheet core domain-containing protein n=1 Tax=Ahniella affigens TaxID=2021234 RepID=A0A2P1PYP7_9GAMM|nr:peptidoglycan DD-metalloendopeptidase family protein [Ahniella affigens]AVP99953.1 hypothetical protein C7S18_01345 [Ahniella affigens]